MKTSELKLRVLTEANSLIDVYFGEDTFIDRMVNTTLKILLEQNKDKYDDMLTLFENRDGEIDATTIINNYAEQFTHDGLHFDIKKFIKNDFIRNMIPDKYLIINKEDILKILK